MERRGSVFSFSLRIFLFGTEECRRGLYDRGGTSIRALAEYLQARTFCTWQANKVRNMRRRLTVCDMQIQHNLYLLPDVIRTHACLMVMERRLSLAAGAIASTTILAGRRRSPRSEKQCLRALFRMRSLSQRVPQILIWCALVTARDNHFRGLLINLTRRRRFLSVGSNARTNSPNLDDPDLSQFFIAERNVCRRRNRYQTSLSILFQGFFEGSR